MAKPAETRTRLYDVLLPAFPRHRLSNGGLDVKKLAQEINLTGEAIYKGLRADRITVATAKLLVAHSRGRLTYEALVDFVFG